MPLLEVRDLSVVFEREGGNGQAGLAVDSVSFSLERGKTLCLVGESGCGKTVTALSLLRLLPSPPARISGGCVLFDGADLAAMNEKQMRQIRGNRAGMVFQDPMTSLNPVMRVGDQIGESLRLHRGMPAAQAREEATAMLERVNIPDPALSIRDFPHQMSGGMRQRVMIAMALACAPDLIIADEPTTALDVTVQKQILDLMRDLIDGSGSGLLLITHDLGVVAQAADDVAVMYAGRIVEQGPVRGVLETPSHPYTIGLLRSRPGAAAPKARLEAIPGVVPGLWTRPDGCTFHPRCPYVFERCRFDAPPLFNLERDRKSRCWLAECDSRADASA
jgi:oligopeptide/dipeptide ABC transporter ATP-binding protein